MAKVAVVMMQRDETLLLEPWLRYHGHLVGFENIFVFDNGSTDQKVIQTLKLFSGVGLNVDFSKTTELDFDRKGYIVGDMIKEFEKEFRYDLVIPLDCDEFISILSADGFSCSRNKILQHLNEIAKPGPMIKVRHCLDNRPGRLDLFRLVSFNKTIVPVGNFLSIDHGFHEARDRATSEYLSCKIIYVHMHYKPFELVKKHAEDKLRPFTDVNNRESLKDFEGVGRHLVRFFYMDHNEYYSDTGDYRYPLVRYDGFVNRLRILMPLMSLEQEWTATPPLSETAIAKIASYKTIDMTQPFDTFAYNQLNPDVAMSGMDATIHFCLFGFREGRATSKLSKIQ